MRRPNLKLCAGLLFAVLGGRAVATQQPPNGSDLRIHIIDGLLDQAVPRVRFTLTGSALVDGLSGTSDAQGDLSLSAVPRGNYRLTLEKAGYFPETYDLSVTASSSKLPDVVMTAKREISGTVRWQDGEAAARASIRVFGVRGGKPVPRTETAQTNDRGEFIVSNLRPGRYILLASPPTFTGGIDPSGRFAAGGIPRLGLPVFYPGVNVPDARTSIDVRGVVSTPNIGIVFEEKPGTIVEGTVVPSATAPMGTDVNVTLGNQGLFSVSTRVRAGDAFRIGPVPAGFYVLDASSQGAQPGRALLSLTIGGTTFRGVTVSIPPPAVLSGQVEIDDPTVRPRAGIVLQSDKLQGTLAGSVGATGEFRIARTVAGETYNMTIDPKTLPSTAYLAAVSQGSREMTTSPFQVAAGDEPVRLVLKTDGGTIQGTVKDAGRVVGLAFVVLAPKDRRLEQNFRIANADREGVFKLPAIAPGDYDLFAFDRNEDDDYLDEVFLQGFEGREVKVSARSTLTADLAVVRIPRR